MVERKEDVQRAEEVKMKIEHINVTKRLGEAAEVIADVLVDEGPYVLGVSTGSAEWTEIVSRERMLEFHLEAVMHEIMDIVEEEEGK